MACGANLALGCPSCGTEAPAGARFCVSCGAALTGDGQAAPAASDAPGRAVSPVSAARAAPAVGSAAQGDGQEERRTVTVLFADISGYTSVAERLDHETVKAVVERCVTRFAAEVELYGGRVDKYIGDNVMAVFGAPVAHEDDAERAVRAAFGMQHAMVELNHELSVEFGLELALRVGVNTGEVLAGRLGDAYTVLGDAVNVAARLQVAAPVGGILVGQRTQRLSASTIDYRELEPLALKGKAERVPAWEALEMSATGSLGSHAAQATPLMGRQEDLARIEGLFVRAVRESAPQLVTVVGEPGVGKSRLLQELERRLEEREQAPRIRRGRCLAFGQAIVYWPLAEMLRAECDIREGEDAATARAKLSMRVVPLLSGSGDAEQVERRIAPLARLLGAGSPGADVVEEPEDQHSAREAFFGVVRAVLEALAQEQALVLAWEDIHWADEGTLDLIDYLSRWLRAPVLQVCLARDQLLERRPAWSSTRRSATVAFLEPLAPKEAERLIESLLEVSGVVSGQARMLAERSGGNPLFAEAMVQRIAEQGAGSAVDLPDTVQGLLAARLDALEPFERQLVMHAAVLGRTFWESALEPVAAGAGEDLQGVLASLREKEIILPGDSRTHAGERELAFKHVLIRDVAYEMLSKAARAQKHAQVAAFILERAGGRGEGTVGLVAEHYARAASFAAEAHLPATELEQLRGLALEHGEAAGDAAAALYSNREALAYYEAAMALVDDEEERAQRIAEKSGDVSLRLGRVESAIELWSGCLEYHSQRADKQHEAELHRKIGAGLAHKGERKKAIAHHQQGINLIKDGEQSLTLVRLYEEAAWLYMQVGDNMLAIYASEKALRLAESLGEARAASRAHGIFGRVFGRIGDAAKARENLERSVELARRSDEGETVLALLALGHNLEHTEGEYEQARERYLEALTLAERIGDVPAQIELQSALAQLAFYRCDWEQVRSATDASAALAEREGLVGKLCLPNVLRGRLCWRNGEWGESKALLTSARDLAEQVGWSEVAFNALLALSATLRDQEEFAQAEAALQEALLVCERAGLVPQSVQAYAALALVATLADHHDVAIEAAAHAQSASTRVHDPAGQASALEATGLVDELPGAIEDLEAARAIWERLKRPLDTARCEMLLARRQMQQPDGAGEQALSRAVALLEAVGLQHRATVAHELADAKRPT
jgi:class 3 adenylate cyclase/tetratricopeptide (TPR) repeat protein